MFFLSFSIYFVLFFIGFMFILILLYYDFQTKTEPKISLYVLQSEQIIIMLHIFKKPAPHTPTPTPSWSTHTGVFTFMCLSFSGLCGCILGCLLVCFYSDGTTQFFCHHHHHHQVQAFLYPDNSCSAIFLTHYSGSTWGLRK